MPASAHMSLEMPGTPLAAHSGMERQSGPRKLAAHGGFSASRVFLKNRLGDGKIECHLEQVSVVINVLHVHVHTSFTDQCLSWELRGRNRAEWSRQAAPCKPAVPHGT